MNMSENEQQKHELLSAFIDGEQSDVEIAQVVDTLLDEQAYKDRYIRMQLVNDSLHDQIEPSIINNKLNTRVSSALEDLPAHFVEDAVQLQNLSTNNVPQSHWFKKIVANKLISGVSVAASVMFVTLMTLQTFNSETTQSSGSTIAATNQQAPTLIQAQSELPIALAASGSDAGANTPAQQYQWIEADPALSSHIRKYINQHETNRAVYSLQPKVRTATYQIQK